MSKRILSLLLAALLSLTALSGCSFSGPKGQHQIAYYDCFDTYISFTAYDISAKDFDAVSEQLHELLYRFHCECDIYHSYDGLVNLKTVNDNAGIGAVTVCNELFEFLSWSVKAFYNSLESVNLLIGAVTGLWEKARETKSLPTDEELEAARPHTRVWLLKLDARNNTVFLDDPEASLDVGALAKGYAGSLARKLLTELGCENWLLDLGGNLVVHGSPVGTGRDSFTLGVLDAAKAYDNSSTSELYTTVSMNEGSVATSGDYQRYFEIDGVRYHHIIDPNTLKPAPYYHSVTVIADDPADADLWSTALFLLPKDAGEDQAERHGFRVIYQ